MNNKSKEISHFITRSVYFAAFIIIVLIATLLPIKMILAAQITNHETVIENIKEKALGSLGKGISSALPNVVEGVMPETTGLPIPPTPPTKSLSMP